jgi:serine/threonine-protein kinase HipA
MDGGGPATIGAAPTRAETPAALTGHKLAEEKMPQKDPNDQTLSVHLDADGESTLIGRAAYSARQRACAFEWSEEAKAKGLDLSPLHMPLRGPLFVGQARLFDGLPGLLNDALPDGWGLLLMDRALSQHGVEIASVSPLERLAFVGRRAMGALRFEPADLRGEAKPRWARLGELADEAQRIHRGATDAVSRELLLAGGSPQGARPKVIAGLNADFSEALVGSDELPEGFSHWLVKFAAADEETSAPAAEAAYCKIAKDVMGLDTSEARVVEIARRKAVATRRFDRDGSKKKFVHSMSGLLHADHRMANCDYTHLAAILRRLPGGENSLEEAFARAAFNLAMHVRDDHTKNHAFMRSADGSWRISPAFDLAFSSGPGGQHTLSFAGQWKDPGGDDLRRLAKDFLLSDAQAGRIIDRARASAASFAKVAEEMGASQKLIRQIGARLRAVDSGMKPASGAVSSPKTRRRP